MQDARGTTWGMVWPHPCPCHGLHPALLQLRCVLQMLHTPIGISRNLIAGLPLPLGVGWRASLAAGVPRLRHGWAMCYCHRVCDLVARPATTPIDKGGVCIDLGARPSPTMRSVDRLPLIDRSAGQHAAIVSVHWHWHWHWCDAQLYDLGRLPARLPCTCCRPAAHTVCAAGHGWLPWHQRSQLAVCCASAALQVRLRRPPSAPDLCPSRASLPPASGPCLSTHPPLCMLRITSTRNRPRPPQDACACTALCKAPLPPAQRRRIRSARPHIAQQYRKRGQGSCLYSEHHECARRDACAKALRPAEHAPTQGRV